MSTPVDLTIRRHAQVRDVAGNVYGIADVAPESEGPAILLAVRVAATDERIGLVLRPGGRVQAPGIDLRVEELIATEPARAHLIGSVDSADGADGTDGTGA